MSLDVYLEIKQFVLKPSDAPQARIYALDDDGSLHIQSREDWDRMFPGREPVRMLAEERTEQVFTYNITHNLNKMAQEAGIYLHLWHPEEVPVTHARELVEPLSAGLARLEAAPEAFRQFDAPNGWGKYEDLVSFVKEYLAACKKSPHASVRTWA